MNKKENYYYDIMYLLKVLAFVTFCNKPAAKYGRFGLCVSKIYHFGLGFGFRVFKNPILGLGSGSGFESFQKNLVLGSGLGWVLQKTSKYQRNFLRKVIFL
jgi:hypothetical protein